MKNKNYLMIFLLIGIVLLFGVFYYGWQDFGENTEITSFEECAEAGYPVMESYPRQCNADGMNFVEEIDWREDGVILMRNSETQDYACFGCGLTMCVDPAPIMQPVQEDDTRYCNYNFEIVVNGLIQKCPDGWIDNQMPSVGPEEERQYFIIDEKRREISDFDMPWIEANCDIEKQVVY
ncbi:hypothetical protein GW924_01445 [Candidatus Pacearchaeota archaeon]|nr:hypothetical protein [Candidatus Pacearchaeota archaeon]OIO43868.1 MAG: hypothetical protein AUJ64_01050 [Candidatus Pacearchaeota archaeon CG1_02_39_14]